MTETSSPFSTLTPGLQLVVDSTSLALWQFCPERYRLEQIEGYRGVGGTSVDLEFGKFMASAYETYKKGRMAGMDKDTATLAALTYVMEATWNEDGTQWGGTFEKQWHCLGTEPYRNAKGNRAKCPYAHKNVWFPEPSPEICGECGSATELETHYLPDHYAKNRIGLARAVVWWCDEQPQDMEDGLSPYVFPDGTPAVEFFAMAPLPYTTSLGERFILTALFDEISQFGDERFVLDNKTTKKPLDEALFSSYAPNMQFDNYDLLAATAFPSLGIQGVIADFTQLLKDAVRTTRWVYYKTDSQREEHLKLLGRILKDMELAAVENYYPMNKRNCGFCPHRGFCALPPEEREEARRRAGLVKSTPWNPMQIR